MKLCQVRVTHRAPPVCLGRFAPGAWLHLAAPSITALSLYKGSSWTDKQAMCPRTMFHVSFLLLHIQWDTRGVRLRDRDTGGWATDFCGVTGTPANCSCSLVVGKDPFESLSLQSLVLAGISFVGTKLVIPCKSGRGVWRLGYRGSILW